jgi:hypothetical protein
MDVGDHRRVLVAPPATRFDLTTLNRLVHPAEDRHHRLTRTGSQCHEQQLEAASQPRIVAERRRVVDDDRLLS